MKDEETHPTIVPKFIYKLCTLRWKKLFLDVSRKSNGLENLILEYLIFYFFRLVSGSKDV